MKEVFRLEIRLYTETTFDGAHQLRGYKGKCSNLHGHTWLVKVWIQGTEEQLDEVGILFDFAKIKEIHNMFDHKFLNHVLGENPTAEHLALNIFRYLKSERPDLHFKVRIYETTIPKKSYAEVGDINARLE